MKISKLEKLIGKSFLYKSKEIEVLGCKNVPDEEVYKVDIRNVKGSVFPIVLKENEVEQFIAELLPVRKPAVPDKISRSINNSFESIAKGLKEDFDKLEHDKDYIGQAKQRAETIRSLVDLVKTQISLNK